MMRLVKVEIEQSGSEEITSVSVAGDNDTVSTYRYPGKLTTSISARHGGGLTIEIIVVPRRTDLMDNSAPPNAAKR